jgi:squalene-hopene/tetraprenyl-beta-curcumene cyclase
MSSSSKSSVAHGLDAGASVAPFSQQEKGVVGEAQQLREECLEAIERAVAKSEEDQDDEGFWVAELKSNVAMEAQWLLCLHVIGRLDKDAALVAKLSSHILRTQRLDGAWEVYYGAPQGDPNATIEAYAALRCAGLSDSHPQVAAALKWILEHQAMRRIRVFTRYWLAILGEWPWRYTPNTPPEIILFPAGAPFSIYRLAAWARATIVPLCIISARRMVRPLPPGRRLDSLFPGGRDKFDYGYHHRANLPWLSLKSFFFGCDTALHALQAIGLHPLREMSVRRCIAWVLNHQEEDGTFGGTQPPWVYSVMALHLEGFSDESGPLHRALGQIWSEDSQWTLLKDGGASITIQCSVSHVWDTALTLVALQECGQGAGHAAERAAQWLLSREITATPGDWELSAEKGATRGGWGFQPVNAYYPDCDDTAVVALALLRHSSEGAYGAALDRAVEWLMQMQCVNGGWAAYDKYSDMEVLTNVPFCDFGEVLDPPSVDVTCHVLEFFAEMGLKHDHPSVARALAYVWAQQEPEGSWWGRWGVNYIYGTAAALCGLRAFEQDMRSAKAMAAGDWILSVQNPDGGWGESCESYMVHSMAGRLEVSTASQTAWALMALHALDRESDDSAIRAGTRFLLRTQTPGGSWEEEWYTGTGFPGYGIGARRDITGPGNLLEEELHQSSELSRAFMLNYGMYRHVFPLIALAKSARKFEERRSVYCASGAPFS